MTYFRTHSGVLYVEHIQNNQIKHVTIRRERRQTDDRMDGRRVTLELLNYLLFLCLGERRVALYLILLLHYFETSIVHEIMISTTFKKLHPLCSIFVF